MSFGEDWTTTSPTAAQIAQVESYCDVALPLESVERIETQWSGSGIDDRCRVSMTLSKGAFEAFCAPNKLDGDVDRLRRKVNAAWTMTVQHGRRVQVVIDSYDQ